MKVTTVNGRRVITASHNKVITDGYDVYGKKIILAVNREESDFYEIGESEVQDGISEQFYNQ